MYCNLKKVALLILAGKVKNNNMKISVFLLLILLSICVTPSYALPNENAKEKTFGNEKIIEIFADKNKDTGQVLLVVNDNDSSHKATVFAYEFAEGRWREGLPTMKGAIGRKGFALPGMKREGDGKTPSGYFPVGMAFGYDASVKTKLIYRQSGVEDKWIDDVNSGDYNKLISGPTKAASYEKMKRKDHLYKYGFVVEYNTAPVIKGHGSAIFFHVIRAEGKATAGCVAVSESDILKLLGWLDPSRKPMVIMGSRSILKNFFSPI